MELDRDQQRAMVAMCAAVARADGEVSPAELERLLYVLARFADGSVSFAELQQWIDQGPPDVTAHLPEENLRTVVQEALSVAHADGKIDDEELRTIKALAERYAG